LLPSNNSYSGIPSAIIDERKKEQFINGTFGKLRAEVDNVVLENGVNADKISIYTK